MFKKIIENLKNNNFFKNNLVIFGIIIIVGFFVLGYFFKSGLSNISVIANSEGVSVSGTAEKYVTSDRGTLSLQIKTDSLNINDKEALKKSIDARDSLIKYLVNYGIDGKEINILPVDISSQCTQREQYNWDNCIGKKYNVYTQNISISSNEVEKIKDLSLNINSKVNNDLSQYFNNVSVSVQSAQYFYTKLSNIKTEMLNEATKNAFDRADAIAKSTGNRAGNVITASQGVFQITSQDSVDSSDYGVYDTSTIEKKITAVVRVSFKVK